MTDEKMPYLFIIGKFTCDKSALLIFCLSASLLFYFSAFKKKPEPALMVPAVNVV
jgi:hypothetical protein